MQAITGLAASNMAPVLPDSVEPVSIPENTRAGSNVGGPVAASDAERDPLSYSLQGSSDFVIDSRTGQIKAADGVVLDFDSGQTSYTLTVGVDDGFEGRDSVTVTITLTDVNEPPVAVADPAVTTEEDTPVTFDVLGNDTDPDEGDTLTVMTITTQPGRGRVVVDTNTQMLTYTPAKDDHDTYTFMYTARDDDPVRMLTSPAARVTVTVNPVNDAPEFETDVTTRTVSESAQPGDEVGTKVEATDVDDITLTYSLSGASDFVIDATGQIRVAPDITLDREHTSSYEVTVTASDRLQRVGQHHRHHQRLQRERGPDRRQRHRDDRRRPVGQNRRAGQRHGSRYGASRADGLGAEGPARRDSARRKRPDHHLHAERELRRREQLHLQRLRRLSQRRRLSHGHRRSGERRPGIPGGDGRALRPRGRRGRRQRRRARDGHGHRQRHAHLPPLRRRLGLVQHRQQRPDRGRPLGSPSISPRRRRMW